MNTDTIVAQATAAGQAALAIVRLSGPEAVGVVAKVFSPAARLASAPSHTSIVGRVLDRGAPIDQVVAAVFRAPGTFTGENMVEITCHGGRYIPSRILDLLCAAGARPANPGEFTLRAFLNGRIDLSQAEAIAALIGAQSSVAARAAMRVLDGGLRTELAKSLERLAEAAATLESQLDIEVDGSPDVCAHSLASDGMTSIEQILAAEDRRLEALLSSSRAAQFLTGGLRVVLAGRPNAGKSSIFNAFLAQERAIVSPHPGTTRDTLESSVEWDGLPIILVDTAGLSEAQSELEREALRRTNQAAAGATVVVLVQDSAASDPAAVAADIASLPQNARLVVALHKWDLPHREGWDAFAEAHLHRAGRKSRAESAGHHLNTAHAIAISSVANPPGLESLRAAVLDVLRAECGNIDESLLVTDRQRQLLVASMDGIKKARALLAQHEGGELVACELQRAMRSVGEIIGQRAGPVVLEKIFSRFCVGK